ncbi:hypothetical protein BDN71DRAFT_1431093 [Pleurotus eryngii]|uniref:Uncharacterized protein n=1 Tax=Pleurotus eryngii TaxID=5323 RepID=A0A9P5ZW14_PLEER|nr:hypothetical protein BDN71DRAFT_1431093 [Pleurotus eryngii]
MLVSELECGTTGLDKEVVPELSHCSCRGVKAVVGIDNSPGDQAVNPDLSSNFKVFGIWKMNSKVTIVGRVIEALMVSSEHGGTCKTSSRKYRNLLKALTSPKQGDFGDITVTLILSQSTIRTCSIRALHDRRSDNEDRLNGSSGDRKELVTQSTSFLMQVEIKKVTKGVKLFTQD